MHSTREVIGQTNPSSINTTAVGVETTNSIPNAWGNDSGNSPPMGERQPVANISTIEPALEYAHRGWSVIPIKPRSKTPLLDTWKEFQERIATDDEIHEWFRNWPDANIAIITGNISGLVVLDVDGDAGRASMNGKTLSVSPQATTARGYHHFFKHPGGSVPTKAGLLPGIDIRGDGGYVVAAPSIHESGHEYSWAISPDEDLADLPEWLRNALENGQQRQKVDTAAVLAGVPEGQRDIELFRLACKLRAADVPYDTALLLVEQAASACKPPFPLNQAKIKVDSAYSRYKPGTSAIITNPDLIEQWLKTNDPTGIHLTDTGNAQIFGMQYGEDVIYCKQIGWFTWDGQRWCRDDTGAVNRLAKQTILDCYASLAGIVDPDFRKLVFKHLQKSESYKSITNMLALAASEPGISVSVGQLDQDQWLFNVLNGTLNLKTRKLQEHYRGNHITRLAPVNYDQQAQCRKFEQFLTEIFQGNRELIRFVQQYFGYSLTGSTEEQCLAILYGTGANGKSTLSKTIQRILGDYASQSPIEAFLIKNGSQIPNDIARLHAARAVFAAESEEGQRLAESLVKQLTGGDLISARFLHHEFFEFEPRFKLILSTNHKPTIRGTDQAIWRRIRLVPFNVSIPPERQDKGLPDALWQERDGIFAWMVRGLEDWLKNGLITAPEVTDATQDYREEQDAIGQFLDDCVYKTCISALGASRLYGVYTWWAKRNGEFVLNQRRFGQAMSERGYKRQRGKGGVQYLDIAINREVDDEYSQWN